MSSQQCWQPPAEHLQLSLAFGKQPLPLFCSQFCFEERIWSTTKPDYYNLKTAPAISIFSLESVRTLNLKAENVSFNCLKSKVSYFNQTFKRTYFIALIFFSFFLSDMKVFKEYLSWISNSSNNLTKCLIQCGYYPRPNLLILWVISRWTSLTYYAWLSATDHLNFHVLYFLLLAKKEDAKKGES